LALKTLTQQEYQAMSEGARVLEADPHGAKVLLLADGTILKLFRRKRLITSAMIFPYAARFAANARKLAALGVPVPEVIDVLRIPGLGRDAVHYRPLSGVTLRQLAGETLADERKRRLREAFNQLVVLLHDNGVYFRSLHIGNVIVTSDDRLGLIDFSDMRIYPWSLGSYLRRRNIQRLYKVAAEIEWVDLPFILSKGRR
jgi:tRNA A-37 threonylcarbamoyl transferase component Bud32